MGLDDIRRRITAAEEKAGRAPGSVTLIAVSKVQPDDRVTAVLDQGQRVFGENYVQEAQGKWPGWRDRWPGVQLHMIGPLQSNKAKVAVGLFDAIHTLDRTSLARKLAQAVEAQGHAPELFVQVNTGDEPQKAGILADELPGFLEQVRAMGLNPQGLMCIPPESEDPAPHFRLLRRLAEDAGLTGLSMGMSADFEAAIAEGATHVRVGSAIFGARDYAAKP
ncbi:YggS family pyridoxal phosphate-dependent enzyme [Paracoccus xiamenensis]|uniref:YggS family pyridoxal phosphate-dependent enzyme n=1 Tax=Paracoccus xiamenensis TaxID=2714901 RepID=UPI00140CCE80|nr:YggS family pyridoxal phosphate-dependent enzyme [Paracoccus xiamenensis]NHF74350.1 YggS family pyridoxal phosphate-dependent enzyme [Paracoccus xiamenensis]